MFTFVLNLLDMDNNSINSALVLIFFTWVAFVGSLCLEEEKPIGPCIFGVYRMTKRNLCMQITHPL